MSTIVRIACVAAGVVIAGSIWKSRNERAAEEQRRQETEDAINNMTNGMTRRMKMRRLESLRRQREHTTYPRTCQILDEEIAALEAELAAL